MDSILISWLGRADLRAVTESSHIGVGPVAQALATGRFERLELLCDSSAEEAENYLAWLGAQTKARVIPHPVMQRVVARARRVALRSIPVLIEGESGTGKELLARAIHQASPRHDRPMITVNCGAIAPELIEAELFGHEKGAFTGASSARKGVFEAADTGTLFLDEIGELPKPAQVRFLRALQEGEVTRVGATAPIRVDVRLLAATNRGLIQEVTDGRFREDLFYRLAVAVIPLPALRDRDGDAALLLDRLLDQVNRESAGEPGYEPKKISVGARKLLLEHP